MSADGNPRLYPSSEPPLPYDTIKPDNVVFTANTPSEGTVLRGDAPGASADLGRRREVKRTSCDLLSGASWCIRQVRVRFQIGRRLSFRAQRGIRSRVADSSLRSE